MDEKNLLRRIHILFLQFLLNAHTNFVLKEEIFPTQKIDTHRLNDNDTIYFEIALKITCTCGQILHTIHFELEEQIFRQN